MRTETSKLFQLGTLLFFIFSFSIVCFAETGLGTQRFEIRTESKSFEKTKFRRLSDAKAAVAEYKRSFNSRTADLNKRCINHFGPGYQYNGLSLKERAIGYMNEDLPIEKFQWKRLVAEVFIQCVKAG